MESRNRSRDRILAMGYAGSGKTYSWLSIAQQSQKRGSEAKFYVLDTDNSVDRMLDVEFPDLTNIVSRPTYEWPDYIEGINEFRSKVSADDWIIVDMVGPAWEAAQEEYVNQVFKKGLDEFFLEARKQEQKSAMDGWRDWGVINKMYRQFSNALLRIPCHLFLTSAVDTISERDDTEEKSNRLLFGPYGVKPRGQKHLAHLVHTVLLMAARKDRGQMLWTATTIKDRGREMLVDTPIKDFSLGYLVSKAGWKL